MVLRAETPSCSLRSVRLLPVLSSVISEPRLLTDQPDAWDTARPLRSLQWAVGEVSRDRTQMYVHISGGRHCTLRTTLTPLGILPQGFSPAFQLFHQPCVVCVTLEKLSATQSHMTSRKTYSVKKKQRYILYGSIFFQEQKPQAGMLNC